MTVAGLPNAATSVRAVSRRNPGTAAGVEIWQVDAFTDALFGGNPAGVAPDARGLSTGLMRRIAREMNLSETAFVLPPSGAGADFRVRFFTPGGEVDLCGHATVATFHVLAWIGAIRPAGPRRTVVQETRAGRLPVAIEFRGGLPARVAMEQSPPTSAPCARPSDVARALGIGPERLDRSLAPECSFTGLWAVMAPLRSVGDLRAVRPRPDLFDALAPSLPLSGVYAFAFGRGGPRARFFVCPRYGIVEDPFTGTAAGALAGYLLRRGRLFEGGSLVVRQGIEMGRAGRADVRVLPGPRIEVAGTAVPVFRATIGTTPSRSRPSG